MKVHERPVKALLARHLIVYPVAGCAAVAWSFAAFVRPNLSGAAWILDVATILCGALGIVIGGTLAFVPREFLRSFRLPAFQLRALAPALACVVLVIALTGLPSVPTAIVGGAGVLLAGSVAMAVARRR